MYNIKNKKFINVSEIAEKLKDILNVKTGINGKKVNETMLKLGMQKLSEDGKSKYKPTEKYKEYAQKIPLNFKSEYPYYLNWESSIVNEILDIAYEEIFSHIVGV